MKDAIDIKLDELRAALDDREPLRRLLDREREMIESTLQNLLLCTQGKSFSVPGKLAGDVAKGILDLREAAKNPEREKEGGVELPQALEPQPGEAQMAGIIDPDECEGHEWDNRTRAENAVWLIRRRTSQRDAWAHQCNMVSEAQSDALSAVSAFLTLVRDMLALCDTGRKGINGLSLWFDSLRAWEQRAKHVVAAIDKPSQVESRDGGGCAHFKRGTPSGDCEGDGHYECRECSLKKHKAPIVGLNMPEQRRIEKEP